MDAQRISQILRRIDDEASALLRGDKGQPRGQGNRVPDVPPAANARASRQPGVDSEVHAVVILLPLAVLRCEGHDVVDLTELLWLEVIEPAEPLPADVAGQARIGRHRDAVRIEVGRRDVQIVGDRLVAEPGPEIAGIDSHPREHFAVDAHRRLPVVGRLAPAFDPVGVRASADLHSTEALIGHRLTLAVGERVAQAAVREEVAVGVGPGPRRTGDRCGRRLEQRRITCEDPAAVAAQAGFDRRLAVAEQVVGKAHPGVDIVPARETVRLRETERIGQRRRGPLEGRRIAVGVLVAKACIDRRPFDPPRILHEQAEAQLDRIQGLHG